MESEFNIQILLENISFLLEQSGKKIGELESEAGVSTGYISRISKDTNTKPGIDFILKVANSFDMSIDTLIKVSLAELTPTERYLVSFLEKLNGDTLEDKLDWNKESVEELNRVEIDQNGYPEHLLFSFETFLEEDESGYPTDVSRVVFVSDSFGCRTSISGNCYNLNLKNRSILYFMNISKSVHKINDPDAYAKEIWIYKPGLGATFLCSNKGPSSLVSLVDGLYGTISERMKFPRIKRELKQIIDAFMDDDLSSDDFDGVPF